MVQRFTATFIFVVGLGAIFFNPTAYAELSHRISESAFIRLTDPKTHELDGSQYAYVPAGTWVRFIKEPKIKFSEKHILVWTENGTVGFIRKAALYSETKMKEFSEYDKAAFFKKSHEYKTAYITLYFTRSEVYPVISGNDSDDDEISDKYVTINVDLTTKIYDIKNKKKLIKTEGDVPAFLEVKIPQEKVRVINVKDKLKSKDILFLSYFERNIADGIIGIEKPCQTKKARAIKTNLRGGFKFDLVNFFASFGAEASLETENIEVFPANKNVRRFYFNRKEETYRLTQYKDCEIGHNEYSFLKFGNEGEEVPITKKWADQNNLLTEPSGGKIRVTCPKEYFAFEEALIEQGFKASEAAFIIAKVARWKEIDTTTCSPAS